MRRHKLHRLKNIHWKVIFPVVVVLVLFLLVAFLIRPKTAGKNGSPTFYRVYGSGYSLEAKLPAAQITTSLGTDQQGAKIKVTRQGTSVEMVQPLPQAKLSLANGNATFTGNGEASYTYQLQPNTLKEDIVLQQKPSTNTFTSVLKLSNLMLRTTSEGIPVFYDASGKYQFHIMAPYAVDAAGKQTKAVSYRIERVNKASNTLQSESKYGLHHQSVLGLTNEAFSDATYTLITVIDKNWLQDAKRVYPVKIDPTITHSTSSAFASGSLSRVTDTGSGSYPNLIDNYQELPANTNTVGLWHMNETSNGTCTGSKDVCDSSGNGNHGTVTGTTINTTTQLLGAAARSFAGAGNTIAYSSVPINTTAGGYNTIEFWMNWNGAATSIMPIGFSNYDLFLSSATCFGFNTGNGDTLGTTTTIPTNQWVHVAAIFYNGVPSVANGSKIYINGVDQSLSYCLGTSSVSRTAATSFNVSGWPSDANYKFTGSIEELRISNVARSPEEIKLDAQRRPYATYTSPPTDLTYAASAWNSFKWTSWGNATGDGETASSSAGLVAQWNFNETSGTTASVATGSCGTTCNGTLTNFISTSGQDVASPQIATGGTITYSGNYAIHTFTSGGTFTAPANMVVEVLVVGGGGGSGGGGNTGYTSGGGGGGGVVYHPGFAVSAGAVTVTVGGGGLAGTQSADVGNTGGNGGNSAFGTLIANGGGGGGGNSQNAAAGSAGGSGGGGSLYSGAGGAANQPSYTGAIVYGNSGGTAQSTYGAGGGGGGAGGAGGNASGGVGGAGGYGIPYALSGSTVYYGGGGAARGTSSNGTAINGATAVTTAGATNTGAGGGGVQSTAGRAGGSGIVIVRYSISRSGWTANDARWGAGALMFDGGSDYVSIGNPAALQITGALTLEAWVNTSATGTYQGYIGKMGSGPPNYGYALRKTSTDVAEMGVSGTGSNWINVAGTTKINDGRWHHLVGVYIPSTSLQIYVDGVLQNTNTTSIPASIYNSAGNVTLGSTYSTPAEMMGGTMDATRIYNRALPAHEILSNYNAANIEFQTRTGNTTNPNDGTWGSWKPTSGETQLDSFDASTLTTTTRVYPVLNDWAISNVNNNQTWVKYNNAVASTCDSPNPCPSNGGIPLGSNGKSDDTHTLLGSVILDGSTYKQWYSCNDGATTRICYATSSDGVTWTKADNVTADNINCDSGSSCGGNGMVGIGSSGRADSVHAEYPVVIKDGSTYRMWYSGYDGNSFRGLYATSADGLTWTKTDNTIPTASNTTGTNGRLPLGTSGGDSSTAVGGGVVPTAVIKDGNTYRLWYMAYDGTNWRIYAATSADGLTWTKTDNTIPTASNTCSTNGRIPLGTSGADTSGTLYPNVIKDGPYYKMWYSGLVSNYNGLYATSVDAVTWCKVNNAAPAAGTSGTDGRIPLGAAATADVTHIIVGPVLKEGNKYRMWYSGFGSTAWTILQAQIASPPLTTGTDSVIKTEGTSSRTLTVTSQAVDNSVVGLWHLDDTGSTLSDSSGYGNTGTNNATVVADGVSGKSRYMVGGQYVLVNDNASLDPTTNRITIESWVKTTQTTDVLYLYKYNGNAPYQGYGLQVSGTTLAGKAACWVGGNAWAGGTSAVNDGRWHHVACVYDGTNVTVYTDGVAGTPLAQTASLSYATPLYIGWNFNGYLDEIKIYNRALSAEEIAESARLGSGYRLSRTYSSTNLSSATKLPFYVASDRQGTFLEATFGNSAFANYETDSSTGGLWYLDEAVGSGNYIKDSSGNNGNGTPTGTSLVQGKMGNARYFNGSSYISVPDSPTLNSSIITIELWINTTDTGASRFLVGKPTGCMTNGFLVWLNENSTPGAGVPGFDAGSVWVDATGASVSDGKWHYVAAVYDGTTAYIYVDGSLRNKAVAGRATASANPLTIGGTTVCGNNFTGSLDNVRISTVARSAADIRAVWEAGKRSHNITIDFKAKLDGSGLISNSSTTSFVIDGTSYGANNKGDKLYVGDRLIVEEMVSGTKYLAQATVSAVTAATGAVNVHPWISGSTFPPSGYTANATVFKWQREYFDITGSLTAQRNAVTNLSLRLTDGGAGANVWLDDLRYSSGYLNTPTGSTITSTGGGNHYLQYRAIFSTSDYAASASLSSVSVDYTSYNPSTTPTLDSPLDTATGISTYPILKTTATDSQGGYLQYKIKICTDVGMTTGCQTVDQSQSQTGWSGQNANGSTAYTSGTQATLTWPTALSNSSIYYWQSWSMNPTAGGNWSGTQATPYSFRTTYPPTAPTSLTVNGLSGSPQIGGATPSFAATYNDPDTGDTAAGYAIQVNTNSSFTGTVMWSGSGTITASQGNPSPGITYAGTALLPNHTYYWKMQFNDVGGAIGAYSSVSQFTYVPQSTVSCSLIKNNTNTNIRVQWANPNATSDSFEIEKNTDSAGFTTLTTVTNPTLYYDDAAVSSGHIFQYRVRAVQGGGYSDWCTTSPLNLQTGSLRMENIQLK